MDNLGTTAERKLIIGTANFGNIYGVNAKQNLSSIDKIAEVLEVARANNITHLDTASNYEGALSFLSNMDLTGFRIDSKINIVEENENSKTANIFQEVENTLNKLKIDKLNSLLIHNPDIFIKRKLDSVIKALEELKRQDLTGKIGVSIYDPEILAHVLPSFAPDLIQAPFNIFDRRIEKTGWAQKLAKGDIQIAIRSIFLQGTLLINKNELPAYLIPWHDAYERWEQFHQQHNCSPFELSTKFAFSQPWASKVIVGVDNHDHLLQLVNNVNKDMKISSLVPDFDIKDNMLLNPFNWLKK